MSRRALRSGGGGDRPSTLAVLPFKPLVAEGRDELLEVGMADSLIARLSTVPGLVVRSVGSVRRYAGIEQDPLRAGARARRGVDRRWLAAAAW
jgi:TolB-like protein